MELIKGVMEFLKFVVEVLKIIEGFNFVVIVDL